MRLTNRILRQASQPVSQAWIWTKGELRTQERNAVGETSGDCGSLQYDNPKEVIPYIYFPRCETRAVDKNLIIKRIIRRINHITLLVNCILC